MTLFALLRDRCGLSHREAAEFLGVRLDTVKSWSSGRNPCPPGVIEALRSLYRSMDRAASEAVKLHKKQRAGTLQLNTGGKRFAEWPGGSGRALLGIVAALVDEPVEISSTEP